MTEHPADGTGRPLGSGAGSDQVQPRISDEDSWVEHFGNPIELDDQIAAEALHGPIGDFAKAMSPAHTEAPRLPLLFTGLSLYSGLLGHSAFSLFSGAKTRPQLFGLVVGRTGSGKGLSFGVWESVLDLLPPDVYDRARLMTAVNSGEGLVKALLRLSPLDDGSTPAQWVIEEFAAVLRAKGREGSTIGQYIRLAYDGRPLQRNTASPEAGTVADPAISFVAHITPQELRDEATRTDAASGFLNRFLVLPALKVDAIPADPPPHLYRQTAARLAESVRVARAHDGLVVQSEEAKRLLMAVKSWQADASSAPGMLGTMLERTSQHIHRMALVYSLSRLNATNQVPVVEDMDVMAAVAIAVASERAVIELWSEAPGTPVQATILNKVRSAEPEGITPTAVLHGYKFGYRDRMKSVIGSMLDQGLLTKRLVPGSRGFRLHVGQAVQQPSLWTDVADSITALPGARHPSARDPKGVSPRGLGGNGLHSAPTDSPGTFETQQPPPSVDPPPVPPHAPLRPGGVDAVVNLTCSRCGAADIYGRTSDGPYLCRSCWQLWTASSSSEVLDGVIPDRPAGRYAR